MSCQFFSVYFNISKSALGLAERALGAAELQVNLQFDNLPCTIDVLFGYSFCFTSFNVSCSRAAFHVRKRTFHAPKVRFMRQAALFGYFVRLMSDTRRISAEN